MRSSRRGCECALPRGRVRAAPARQLSRKLRGNSVQGALSLLDADGRPQSPGIVATEPAVGPGHPALIGAGSAGSKPHGNKVSAQPAPFDFGVDKSELRKAAAERARAAMDAMLRRAKRGAASGANGLDMHRIQAMRAVMLGNGTMLAEALGAIAVNGTR